MADPSRDPMNRERVPLAQLLQALGEDLLAAAVLRGNRIALDELLRQFERRQFRHSHRA